ncbi:hypothetical protein GCM10017559_06840 [Streptosporangium longisporum]|uniref:Uncharacterized protein n=1 Tax=Streptosporangium longisporum TaxID=46187 RepID=A0ABN3XTJ1_9ACTN
MAQTRTSCEGDSRGRPTRGVRPTESISESKRMMYGFRLGVTCLVVQAGTCGTRRPAREVRGTGGVALR